MTGLTDQETLTVLHALHYCAKHDGSFTTSARPEHVTRRKAAIELTFKILGPSSRDKRTVGRMIYSRAYNLVRTLSKRFDKDGAIR